MARKSYTPEYKAKLVIQVLRGEKELNENAIREAFRQAQRMFHSRTLPQMEQLINLYLDKVLVYPDYVEIHLNNVPTNLLPPSKPQDKPATSGLHNQRVTYILYRNVRQFWTEKSIGRKREI